MDEFNKSQKEKDADFLFGDESDKELDNVLEEDSSNKLEDKEEVENSQVLEQEEVKGEEKSFNEEESKAKKYGYLTKEEYIAKHGSLDGFKTPEQFNKYGEAWSEVADVIKGIKQKLDERDKQIDSLVKYNERIETKAMMQARQALELQLQQAKEMNDIQAVEALTEQKVKIDMQAVQEAFAKIEQNRVKIESDFINRNKHWFGVDPLMTDRARQLDVMFKIQAEQAGKMIDYGQLAAQIEHQLKIEFPDKMINNTVGNSAPVISSSVSSVNKSNVVDNSNNVDNIFNKLSQEQKDLFNLTNSSLQRMNKKPYSKKQYIQRLQKFGEI